MAGNKCSTYMAEILIQNIAGRFKITIHTWEGYKYSTYRAEIQMQNIEGRDTNIKTWQRYNNITYP